jgi:hypothetical protein
MIPFGFTGILMKENSYAMILLILGVTVGPSRARSAGVC